MGKKIGNILIVSVFFFSSLIADPVVTLTVQNTYGKRIASPQKGVPFACKVTLSDTVSHRVQPRVDGIENFEQLGVQSSNSLTITNGSQKAVSQYTFTLRASEEKEYVLGPARCVIDGQEYVSNVLSFTPTLTDQSISGQEKKDVFVQVECEKSTVYHKELFPLVITAYIADDTLSVRGIVKPESKGFVVEKMEQLSSSQKLKEGILYDTFSWKLWVYCDQLEQLVVDPFQIVVHKEDKEEDPFMMFSMLTRRTQEMVIYSNSLSLHVKPLPEHTPAIDAVGDYTDFIVKIDNPTVPQNEGLLLRLIVAATGNLAHIKHPQLALPDGFSVYEGAAHIERNGNAVYRVFEYTLQAEKEGVFTIDAQQFTYFDPKTERYEVLYSRPCTLTITESEKKREQSALTEKVDDMVDTKKEGLPTTAGFSYSLPTSFNHFLFFLLILLLVLLLLFFSCKDYFLFYIDQYRIKRNYKNAFFVARKEVKKALHQNKDQLFYSAFYTLSLSRLKVSLDIDPFRAITERLKEKKALDQELMLWKEYSQLLEKSSFFGAMTMKEVAFLKEHGVGLLDILEKYL